MAGPWAGLRWWRGGALGRPPTGMPARLEPAWRRQMAWGNVPDAFVELCMACGLTNMGRKRMCDRIGRAVREAAFQAVDLGRAQHAVQERHEAALARSAGTPPRSPASDVGSVSSSGSDDARDRGAWSDAPRVGQPNVRAAQATAHRADEAARVANATAARTAARAAEQAEEALAAAATAAATAVVRPGRFTKTDAASPAARLCTSSSEAAASPAPRGRSSGHGWSAAKLAQRTRSCGHAPRLGGHSRDRAWPGPGRASPAWPWPTATRAWPWCARSGRAAPSAAPQRCADHLSPERVRRSARPGAWPIDWRLLPRWTRRSAAPRCRGKPRRARPPASAAAPCTVSSAGPPRPTGRLDGAPSDGGQWFAVIAAPV